MGKAKMTYIKVDRVNPEADNMFAERTDVDYDYLNKQLKNTMNASSGWENPQPNYYSFTIAHENLFPFDPLPYGPETHFVKP